MDGISVYLKLVSVKEVSVFLLCCVSTYLLHLRHSYGLVPSWRIDLDESVYQNGRFPQQWEHLPSPVVADIDSDNFNELLLATVKPPRLQLFKLPDRHDSPVSKVLLYMQLRAEVPLVTRNGTQVARRPRALATGYLEAYGTTQLRRQVIVVVMSDWTVLCFDHTLTLLWETRLMTTSRYYISEITVLISRHNIKPGDGGLIIVGIRLGDRHPKKDTVKHDHKRKTSRQHVHTQDEEEEDQNYDEDDVDEDKGVQQVENDFSVFALSGVNGSSRWQCTPGGLETVTTTEKELFAAHHYKLALHRGLSLGSRKNWNRYSQAILRNMPHRWQRGTDTTLTIDRWIKDTTTTPSQKDDISDEAPTLSAVLGLEGKHLAGFAFGGLEPHSPIEHVKNPNAVVIHMHKGIEVLDLITGTPLTRLPLVNDVATYADVDTSGSIDQIKAHFTTDHTHKDNCMAVARSGIPPQAPLFNGSLCEAHSFMEALSGSVFGKENKIKENPSLAVAPIVVKSVAKRSGLVNHLLGTSNYRTPRGWDSVFVISNGRATSYGPTGHMNWQVKTNAKWNDILTVFKSTHHFPSEIIERYHYGFQPGLQPMSLKIFDDMDSALLVGWDHAVIISLVDGRTVAEHTLPCQPLAPVVIGDFDSDGYNDVILQCATRIVGFRLVIHSAYWATVLVGVTIMLVVLGLTSLFSSEFHYLEEIQPPEGQPLHHSNHDS